MLQQFLRGPGLIGLFLFFGSQPICAQSKTPKFEVGAQFSLIRFSDLDITEPGFGGRFTYNINKHVAVEAEGSFFPREVKDSFGETLQGGRKTEGLFGVKFGARNRRVGWFGKVRPGFIHFGNFEKTGVVCIAVSPCVLPTPPFNFSETDFAMDIGGVFELYPARRTVIRFDLGDTIIHSSSAERIALPTTLVFSNLGSIPGIKDVVRSTSNNFQFSVGVGFRF